MPKGQSLEQNPIKEKKKKKNCDHRLTDEKKNFLNKKIKTDLINIKTQFYFLIF